MSWLGLGQYPFNLAELSVNGDKAHGADLGAMFAAGAMFFFVFGLSFSLIDPTIIPGLAHTTYEQRLWPPLGVGVMCLISGGFLSAREILEALVSALVEAANRTG